MLCKLKLPILILLKDCNKSGTIKLEFWLLQKWTKFSLCVSLFRCSLVLIMYKNGHIFLFVFRDLHLVALIFSTLG